MNDIGGPAKRNKPTNAPAQSWVDSERGLVERDAFLSDDICKLEFDRIFDRTWMFLAHETEIPAAGDYVSRMLGSAPVIVVRDANGAVHALLNSCRHRGTKLCRGDQGNAARFVCPYHGWAYEHDGKLITTTFDRHFPKDTDFSTLGLIPVPRVESYKGLLFGCWDADVIGLEQFLGDFRWYLDLFFGRTPGGMEVLAPPHRWRVKANWKVGALNFIGDSQHVLTTHVGPLTLDPLRSASAGFAKVAEESFQVFTDEGHGATLSYLIAQGLPDWAYHTHAVDLEPHYRKALTPEQLATIQKLRVVVGNVFPNLSFIETQAAQGEKSVIMRQWRPLGGAETEIMSWSLAEREATPEYKAHVLPLGFRNFGAAGMFEQDDMELWTSAAAASQNPIARQYPWGFQTALKFMHNPERHPDRPGRIFRPADIEVAQFEFMRHWDRVMQTNA